MTDNIDTEKVFDWMNTLSKDMLKDVIHTTLYIYGVRFGTDKNAKPVGIVDWKEGK